MGSLLCAWVPVRVPFAGSQASLLGESALGNSPEEEDTPLVDTDHPSFVVQRVDLEGKMVGAQPFHP